MGYKRKVEMAAILACLRDGFNLTQTARKLGISVEAVRKRTAKLRAAGQVLRIKGYPHTYKVLEPEDKANLFASIGDRDFNLEPTINHPARTFEPHKFGEKYEVVSGKLAGGRSWSLRSGALCRRWLFPTFTVLGYSGKRGEKLVAYVKAFKGFSPNEQIVDGRTRLRAFLADFAAKNGLQLRFAGYVGAREWTTTTIGGGLSEELIGGLDLRKDAKRVGDVVFSTDKSHPGRAEFKTLDEKTLGKAPDVYAERMHRLIVTDVAQRVDELERGQQIGFDETLKGVEAIMGRIRKLEEAKPPAEQPIVPRAPEERPEVG